MTSECFTATLLTKLAYFREMPPKDADRMVNDADPDQTVPAEL